MKVPSDELDRWTAEVAGDIPTVAGVDALALLRAICRQESSYGALCNTRHEDGWCPNINHKVSDAAKQRHYQYGCLACCSYGPMQVLYHSLADYSLVLDPTTLLNPRFAFDKSIALLIRKLLRQHPQSITGIADLWNSGSCNDSYIPKDYINSLTSYYQQELTRLGK